MWFKHHLSKKELRARKSVYNATSYQKHKDEIKQKKKKKKLEKLELLRKQLGIESPNKDIEKKDTTPYMGL